LFVRIAVKNRHNMLHSSLRHKVDRNNAYRKEDVYMLDRYLQPRHWSPSQGYATGDVVISLLSQGWQVSSVQPAPGQTRARLHCISLTRDGESLDLLVLDGPAIQSIVFKLLPA
jgi:hypothetical protein